MRNLSLGILSSFLGIGGRLINLVVLFFFFSQLAILISTLITGSVTHFVPELLLLRIAGGITVGIMGRSINKKISDDAVSKLFILLMIVIIGINMFNIYKFTG